ncbi:MAG TPA: peptide chain release factor N(5)-glutamine methyltransferase [Steroidobacteraceae bacterium]
MTRSADALASLQERLAAASPTASLDAEILLAHVLGTSRAALAAAPGRTLAPSQAWELEALALRRIVGEPVAYLTGRREFWSLDLEVTPAVLVPRPETELVIELALAALAGVSCPAVLDLGTGSGAIALALARERDDADVTAVDASTAALEVARRNARRLRIGNVRFLRGSWYVPVGTGRFNAIVSNPPYVAEGDPALATLAHEPREALVSGRDGLDAIAAICAGASQHLVPGGRLFVEHGAAQGAAVRELLSAAGLGEVATHRDLGSRERVTAGTAPPQALESAGGQESRQ